MDNNILDDNLLDEPSNFEKVEYAGFWIRAVASFLDSLVFLPVMWLSNQNTTNFKSIVLAIVISVCQFLYKPLMEGEKGATLGKMACGLIVVDLNYNPISIKRSFLRSAPWFGYFILGIYMTITMYSIPGFENVDSFLGTSDLLQNSSLITINTIYSLIFTVIVVTVAFDERKQGLHDRLGGTFVIKENKSLLE